MRTVICWMWKRPSDTTKKPLKFTKSDGHNVVYVVIHKIPICTLMLQNRFFSVHGHLSSRAEIQQAPLSQFSLLADFLIVKLSFKDFDWRVLNLVNLNLDNDRLRYLESFDKPGQDLSRKSFGKFVCNVKYSRGN